METSPEDKGIRIHLVFAPESVIELSGTEEMTFHLRSQLLTVDQITRPIRESILLLQAPGVTMDELMVHGSTGSKPERARLVALLMKLSRSGIIWHTLFIDNRRVLSTYAVSPYYRQLPVPIDGTYQLSRFAYLHRVGSELLLESPIAHAQAMVHDWRAVGLLLPASGEDPAASLNHSEHQAIWGFLAQAGLAIVKSENDQFSEGNDDILSQWEFHDLLFHSRSRVGRHANPIGGTFRFLGAIDPLPLKKRAMSEIIVPLFKPDLSGLMENDTPFTQVFEQRRSIRTPVEQTINIIQLGEFLYRCCHVQKITEGEPELSLRPTPSGGAIHPLEIYLVVRRCEGLAPGFYHFCPHEHHLEQLEVAEEDQSSFLRFAERAQSGQNRPSILFLYAARFQRVSWKYSSIAYATILKDAGALQQTMYLVATAMDLAPCAIGAGDSDLFARVTGLRYEIESTVGEFALQ